jgi:hypothetical protein
MWKKYGTARQDTDDNITRRMRFACWTTKATDTHSEYVILIAFTRLKRLRERASMLRYTYIDCLVTVTVTVTVTATQLDESAQSGRYFCQSDPNICCVEKI